MASIGGFFKAIGHGLKVAFGNPTALRLEAGVVGILFPGFGTLANSAANAIISAEGAAADALSKPMQAADVQLAPSTGESVSATAKKRRQTFGIGSAGSGVNI